VPLAVQRRQVASAGGGAGLPAKLVRHAGGQVLLQEQYLLNKLLNIHFKKKLFKFIKETQETCTIPKSKVFF